MPLPIEMTSTIQEALSAFTRLLNDRSTLLTHNYVIIETAALLHRRLGWEVAQRFLVDAMRFTVRWLDEVLHRRAVERWQAGQGRVSLVDAVSFLVMREAEAGDALAFDEDFQREGFRTYRA